MRLATPDPPDRTRRPRRPALLDVAAADRAAVAGDGDRPRRRLRQGEPRRLRRGSARRTAGRRSATTSAATARARTRCRPRRSPTSAGWRRCSPRVDGVDERLRLRARLEHGRLPGDPRAPRPIRRVAGVIAICPATEEGLRRGLREGRFEMRADVDALDAWLGEHDLARAAAAGSRRSRSSSSTPAATSRSRASGRRSSTPGPATRGGS